jgi:hypothetical protein
MMLVQRKHQNDTEVGDGTIKSIAIENIRFNSARNTRHSRSMAHTTLSRRSRACPCECHVYSVGDSTLDLNDDPELLKAPGLDEGSENVI